MWGWEKYVPVAERIAKAKKKMEPAFMNAGASLITFGVKKALPMILEKLDKINFNK